MADFLKNLGALSLGGGIVILLLLASGFLTRSRYASRWRCWGWLLLCLRLALPFPMFSVITEHAEAPIQLPAISDQLIYIPQPASSSTNHFDSSSATTSPQHQPNQPNQSTQTSVTDVFNAFNLTLPHLVFLAWALGASVVLALQLFRHMRFIRFVHRWSAPVSDADTLTLLQQTGENLNLNKLPRLATCEGLSVPMLAGILNPVLLLPKDKLSRDSLGYSLLHELTHYRRKDILLKALCLWVCALHWFNPTVWLMARAVEQDTELACDDAALRILPVEKHAAYGQTILTAVARLKGV